LSIVTRIIANSICVQCFIVWVIVFVDWLAGSYVSQEIGWEDYYSRDIFRVEGFPQQRPDRRVIYCLSILSLFAQKAQKHYVEITYSGQDSETAVTEK